MPTRTMDLSLRDALGGVGGGRGGLAPGAGAGDGVMKMDFMSSLEKETYDDKVGETMSKSDYRPLLDGKDGAKGSGPGMMSSMMSLGGRQDPAGQPAFSSDYLSGPKNLVGGGSDPWSQTKTKDSSVTDSMLGFSQPGMGTGLGMGMGAGMPPSFQSGMSSPSPAGFAQAAPGFGLDPKTAGSTGGSSPLKTSPGSGVHSMDQFSGKPDNKDKQEKVDDKKEKEKEVQKQELQDKGLKSEKILKSEEAVKAEKSLLDRNEKMGEKIGEKKDKPEKTNKDEKEEEKKKGEEKKVEKEEKGGKAVAKSPTAAKGLPSPNGKNKPDAGSAKPNTTKSRPSTLSTNGEASSAKRPSPTTASANKKSPGTKATTPTAAKKAAKTPDNSTAEKRPAVPKATPTPRASVNKPTSPGNKVDKPEGKAADTKKAATPKTTAPRPRPRPAPGPSPSPSPSPAQGAAAASNGELSHRRRTLTKPPVPKQTPVDKKAAAAPRPPRTPRPLNTPTPDLKNIRSKIGSTDNIKYQPGGGKVTQNSKTSDSSTPAAKPRVQILNRKVDLSKVTSKCGSKDNIKYKPGGGDVKIESHKMSIKAKSKIGSLDNVGLDPPSSGATNGHKEKAENKASTPPSTAPTTGPGSVAKAGAAPGGVAKENGVKEPMPSTPFGGDGLNQPLSMNKQLTETN
ncbi:unnamed protein product [Arctogadus glacialis]